MTWQEQALNTSNCSIFSGFPMVYETHLLQKIWATFDEKLDSDVLSGGACMDVQISLKVIFI